MARSSQNTFLTVFIALGCAVGSGCMEDVDQAPMIKAQDLPTLPEATSGEDLPRGIEQSTRDLTLAFVGEVRGELEPCGCPTLPFGGFERRHTQLDHLRKSGPGPLFHIDLGDMLVKGIATRRGDDLRSRADEMLRLSTIVGVDLWIPGPSDLVALDVGRLREARGPKRVSATWMDSGGTAIFPAFGVLERGGIRIGVIGLSAPPPTDSGLQHVDPVDATTATLPQLPSDLDWIIAAGSLSDDDAARVARVKGLSAVFTTRGASYESPALDRPNTPVIETPDRGRYIQVVYARLGSLPGAPLFLHPDPPTWRARLAAIRRGDTDTLNEVGRGRNIGLVNTIPLSADLDRGGAVSDRLRTYKAAQRIKAEKRAGVSDPHKPVYASSGACVNCHTKEFARWTLTGHARAWRSLVERKATDNPECVVCHSTAYGESGGLGKLSATNIRKFKGVQCEMCHGPMGGHPSNPQVQPETVTKATCIGCHDEANSPDFVFSKYLAQASCQGGAPALVPQPIRP
jgi:hypothetical protein